MCDYSLEMYASRPAREGEQYRTARFPSGSIGVKSPGDPETAICLACGTPVEITGIPANIQAGCNVNESEQAEFTRLEHGAYRDGIAFANGRRVSLQTLGQGVGIALTQNKDNEPLPFAKMLELA